MEDRNSARRSEVGKILEAANALADAKTREERSESADQFDSVRVELCRLSSSELNKTLDGVMRQSDDAWVSRGADGKVKSLNFRITDFGFIGMDLDCRRGR